MGCARLITVACWAVIKGWKPPLSLLRAQLNKPWDTAVPGRDVLRASEPEPSAPRPANACLHRLTPAAWGPPARGKLCLYSSLMGKRLVKCSALSNGNHGPSCCYYCHISFLTLK